MLVFVVGSYEPFYVSKHKNTSGYSSEDFYRLRELLAETQSRITTPHILTEVSNLLAQSEGPVKRSYFRAFAEVIGLFDEIHVTAKRIALRDQFAEFRIDGPRDPRGCGLDLSRDHCRLKARIVPG